MIFAVNWPKIFCFHFPFVFTAGIVRATLFGGATLIADRDFASGSAVVVVGGVRKSCCDGFSITRFSDLRPNNCFSSHAIRTLSCWFSSVSVLYSSRNANKVVFRVASDAGSFDSIRFAGVVAAWRCCHAWINQSCSKISAKIVRNVSFF